MVFSFVPIQHVSSSNSGQFTKRHSGSHVYFWLKTSIIFFFYVKMATLYLPTQNEFRPCRLTWLPLRNAHAGRRLNLHPNVTGLEATAWASGRELADLWLGEKNALLPADAKSIKSGLIEEGRMLLEWVHVKSDHLLSKRPHANLGFS